nr:protease HtpX [Candidatus Methylacidithermus pantelleriae]
MIKRLFLLGLTNLAVIVLLTLVVSLLGLDQRLGFDPKSLMVFALVLGFSGSLFSLFISKWMAKMAYQIRVIEEPRNASERWLVETVREQARRAGIGMPEVGVYESPEVNAFATGASRNHALVAVSTGLLEQLSPREAEGVLAHEITHISNGDMVTMALLQGVLNTFVIFVSWVIGFLFDRLLTRRDDREDWGFGGIGLGFYVGRFLSEMCLGLLATLIVMWYSRQREFRADAGSARIWGKDAILSALRHLKAIMEHEPILDNRAPSLSAFKINGHSGGGLVALLASHPPLEERIAALERLQI